MEASSSAEMDESVAALFEEPRPPSSLPSSLDHRSGQSSEELKQLLLRATMDLETTRAQAKLYKNELCHIKDLLKSARQERDEAREEVWKLKESFLSASAATWVSNGAITSAAALQPVDSLNSGGATDYSLHIQHSSKASSSPGQHMQLDCISSSIHNLHWDLHDLPTLRPIFPDVQSNNLSPLLCGTRGASKGASATAVTAIMSMDMDQLSSDQHIMQQQESAIFSEANELLEQEVQAGQEESNAHDEFGLDDVLQRQATSLVEHWARGGGIVGIDTLHQMALRQEELLVKPDDYQGVMGYTQSNQQTINVLDCHSHGDRLHSVSQRHPFKDTVSLMELPSEVNDLHEFLSCSDAGAGDQLSVQAAATTSPNSDVGLSMELPWQGSEHGSDMHTSNPCTPTERNTALYAGLKHLPEPPESDPEVMLRSLPERGKLLQAVMQAGPLLHTLLLAGPLPRWRRPPPPAPVDPMESSLMMQCCNNAGNIASLTYNTMHKSQFPTFPLSSLSTGQGGTSSSADQGSRNNILMNVSSAPASASAAAATWAMSSAMARMQAAGATLNEMSALLPSSLRLSMSTPSSASMPMSSTMTRIGAATTSTKRIGEATTSTMTTMPKADDEDQAAGGLKLSGRSAGGDVSSSWMSTLMEPWQGSKSNKASTSTYITPMLNTSTNLSYSNRLLRSSALLPKRLIFNNKLRRH